MLRDPSPLEPSDETSERDPALDPSPSWDPIGDGLVRAPVLVPAPAHRELGLDPFLVIERMKRVFSGLERELVGFGPLLTQTVYALLTGENLLIFSPPGTAKTLYAGSIFSRIRSGGASSESKR